MDALERLRAMVEELIAELDEARKRCAEFQRDLAQVSEEREQARQEAWRWRSLYCFTSTELESEYPFPWEEKS